MAFKRSRRKKHKSRKPSWFGNLLLELVGIVALLFVIALSGNNDHRPDHRLSYQSADMGRAVADFLCDQIEYQSSIAE